LNKSDKYIIKPCFYHRTKAGQLSMPLWLESIRYWFLFNCGEWLTDYRFAHLEASNNYPFLFFYAKPERSSAWL
jgi:hypothetical protein